jgi:hypothetical protein
MIRICIGERIESLMHIFYYKTFGNLAGISAYKQLLWLTDYLSMLYDNRVFSKQFYSRIERWVV